MCVAAAVASTTWLMAGCSGEPQGDPLARAEAALAKRDYRLATVELKSLLVKEPNSAMGRYLMGVLLLEQGQAAGALAEFNKAIELQLDDERLQGAHAKALLANGRYQELLKQYDAPAFKSPAVMGDVWTALAIAHLHFGRIAKAEEALAAALSADPRSGWALVTKARMAAIGGNVDAALALVQKAIDTGRVNGESLHLKGAILQSRNDMVGAEAAYKEAVKDPRYARLAHLALVNLYVAQRRIPELKDLQARMAKSAPGSVALQRISAQIAYLESRFDQAREELDKLLKIAPNDPELLVFSGAVDLRRGALLQAESQLGRAMQRSDDGGVARLLLTETYLKSGQPDKALSTLRPLLERAEPPQAALVMAGDAHMQLGQHQQASALLEAALRQRPDDPALKTAAALSLLARGQADEALAALVRISASDSGDIADKALISAHVRRREFAAALAAVDRLQKKYPDRIDVLLHRGLILEAQGDATAARQAFERVLQAQPQHYAASANLARLDAADGRIAEARERLKGLVATYPKSAAARMTLVDFLSAQGEPPDEIKTVLEQGVTALPDESALRVALVTHLLRRGEAKAALNVAQQAESVFPGQPEVLDALGRALADAGDTQQALSVFGRIATLQPSQPRPQLRLADVHARRGDLVAATRNLRRVAELAPESPELYQRLIALVRRTRDPAPALNIARDIQRALPRSAYGFVVEGDIHAERRNWPAAIAAFRAGIDKVDPQSRAPIRVFDALRVSGQDAAARFFVEEHLRARPGDARFLEHVGLAAIQRARLGEAERFLKLAVAADGKSAAAWNNLAFVQAERGSPEALASVERALGLAPVSPAVLDTAAKVFAAQGQLSKALEYQRKAVQTSQQAPDYRLQLARLLTQAGDKVAAKSELDALAALGARYPGQAAVNRLRETLEAR
jgi:putative PEP-CTERM system TPR-repeat lipoprotein